MNCPFSQRLPPKFPSRIRVAAEAWPIGYNIVIQPQHCQYQRIGWIQIPVADVDVKNPFLHA
jgi:hypothetical protein